MPLPVGHPPFSSFSSFHGVRAAKPLFYWLECRFVIFAIFVRNPLFLAGQKHGLPKAPFSGPRRKCLCAFSGRHAGSSSTITSPTQSFFSLMLSFHCVDSPSTSYRIGKPTTCKNTPQHTKHETPRNTSSNTPSNTQKIRNSYFFGIFLVFSGYFFDPLL